MVTVKRRRVLWRSYGAAVLMLAFNSLLLAVLLSLSRSRSHIVDKYKLRIIEIDNLQKRLLEFEKTITDSLKVATNASVCSTNVSSLQIVEKSNLQIVKIAKDFQTSHNKNACYSFGRVWMLGDSTPWGVVRYISATRMILDNAGESVTVKAAELGEQLASIDP